MPLCAVPAAVTQESVIALDIHNSTAEGAECSWRQHVHAQTTLKLDDEFVAAHRQAQLHRGDGGKEIASPRRCLRPQLCQIRWAAATRGKVSLQRIHVKAAGQGLLATGRAINKRQRIQYRARCVVSGQSGVELKVLHSAARVLGDDLRSRLGQEPGECTTRARGSTRIEIAASTGRPKGRRKECRRPMALRAPQTAPPAGDATGCTAPLFIIWVQPNDVGKRRGQRVVERRKG